MAHQSIPGTDENLQPGFDGDVFLMGALWEHLFSQYISVTDFNGYLNPSSYTLRRLTREGTHLGEIFLLLIAADVQLAGSVCNDQRQQLSTAGIQF